MYKFIVAAALVFGFASCSVLPDIPKPHELPAPDRIFVHKNPRPGDFAIYQANEITRHRYEVYKRSGNRVTVRYRMNYTKQSLKKLEPKEWYYRLITLSGKVLKAWAITDDGKRFETTVASANGMGGYENFTKISKLPKDSVTVGSRKFRVDAVNAYIYRLDLRLAKNRSSCVEYHSNRVPFRVLKREMVHSAENGAFLKSLEVLAAVGQSYFTQDYLDIYKKANQKPKVHGTTFRLIQYGYGK